jgi:starvation-inducible DNA-binding protein
MITTLDVDRIIRNAAPMLHQQGRDDGTNDLIVSNIISTNEMEAWFFAEPLADTPIVRAP